MSQPSIRKSSPSDGASLGAFPCAHQQEVDDAVARARAASAGWQGTPLKERLRILERLKRVLREEGAALAEEIARDTGKPIVDALLTELASVPLFLDHYRRRAPRVLRRRRVHTPLVFFPRKSYVEPFPLGVVAVISPWNFPFQLAVVPMLSALIAGNTVVLKPSEVTPLTGRLIEELFQRIRLPTGVVEVVHGDGSTGAYLSRADVDKIFFTGSVQTGRKVMLAAAERPIPVELELGGKDAFIVCADADLDRAARAAVWGGLLNAGQMCVSVERIFVVDSVHDIFVEKLQREIERVRVGAPNEDADMGPITSLPQLAIIERHVRSAIKAGAKLLHGGTRLDRPGNFYAPTLLTDVTPDMEIYREETFGPVLPVIRVSDEREALRHTNDHVYGLTASVWTRDHRRGLELASRIEAGQVNVNDVVVSVGNPALPFGGVKSSGFGRYHGDDGLLAFCHMRAIMVSRGAAFGDPFWFPYQRKVDDTLMLFHALLDGNLIRALRAQLRLARRGAEPGDR